MPQAKIESRAERLKAALRENLKRRKAQARGRDGSSGTRGEEPSPGDRADETR